MLLILIRSFSLSIKTNVFIEEKGGGEKRQSSSSLGIGKDKQFECQSCEY